MPPRAQPSCTVRPSTSRSNPSTASPPSTLGRPGRSRGRLVLSAVRIRRDGDLKPQSQGAHHLEHGGEFRVAVGGKRLVQALPAQPPPPAPPPPFAGRGRCPQASPGSGRDRPHPVRRSDRRPCPPRTPDARPDPTAGSASLPYPLPPTALWPTPALFSRLDPRHPTIYCVLRRRRFGSGRCRILERKISESGRTGAPISRNETMGKSIALSF